LITGEVPFNGGNTQEIIFSVKRGKFNLNQPIWEKVSKDVKDLIFNMLK